MLAVVSMSSSNWYEWSDSRIVVQKRKVNFNVVLFLFLFCYQSLEFECDRCCLSIMFCTLAEYYLRFKEYSVANKQKDIFQKIYAQLMQF